MHRHHFDVEMVERLDNRGFDSCEPGNRRDLQT